MASDPRAGADVASHQREEGGSLFDGAVAFQEALHAVAGMKLEGPLPKPMCVRKPPGPLKACGLPLRRLNDHGTKLVTFVDILIDQPPFDWDKLEEECLRSNYDALPEALTLGAKPGIPYTMQVFVVPDGLEEAATCTVVKHVCFRPNKVHLDTVRRLCRGQAMSIDYGKNFREGALALQYMLEELGGFQARYFVLSPKNAPKAQKPDQKSLTMGFRYIRECGPKANNANQFVEWTECEVIDEDSPIYRWDKGLVEKSLRNYAFGKSTCRTLTYCPLTLKSFQPWFLDDILVKMLGTLDVCSIMWLGVTQCGKSTGAKIVAFQMSAFAIDKHDRADLEPAIVTAKHLDFFRGEPGSKFKPAIFDDGLLNKQDVASSKAFHDPADPDALVWARYTASSFEPNQSRQSCANPFDSDAEPTRGKMCDGVEYVQHVEFMKMIRPAFHDEAAPEDIDAILRRAHVILGTKEYIYYRLANRSAVEVPRMPWPDKANPDYLVPAARPIVAEWKKGRQTMPVNYHEDYIWSKALVARLMSGGAAPPRTITVKGPSLGSSQMETIYTHATIMPDAEMKRQVKREREQTFFKMNKSFACALPGKATIFDLSDSPVPSPLRKQSRGSSSWEAPAMATTRKEKLEKDNEMDAGEKLEKDDEVDAGEKLEKDREVDAGFGSEEEDPFGHGHGLLGPLTQELGEMIGQGLTEAEDTYFNAKVKQEKQEEFFVKAKQVAHKEPVVDLTYGDD